MGGLGSYREGVPSSRMSFIVFIIYNIQRDICLFWGSVDIHILISSVIISKYLAMRVSILLVDYEL